MAITLTHKETNFGVGDVVRVHQQIMEDGKKARTQVFEGMVIGIKGEGQGKSFTVRRIGTQKIGIEQIYPINSPVIEQVQVVREGRRGVRRAKLYYTRDKSTRQIETIYSRARRREEAKAQKPKQAKKVASTKKKTKSKKTPSKKA